MSKDAIAREERIDIVVEKSDGEIELACVKERFATSTDKL
jgi:hypothetical protein